MCDFDPWETTVQNTTHIWTVMFLLKFKTKKKTVGTRKIAECLKWFTKYIFLHKNINSRRKEVRHYSNWMQANLSKFAIYSNYQFKEKKLLTHFVENESVISPFKVYWHKPCFFDRKDLFQWVSLMWSFVINYYIVLVLHPRLRKIFWFFKIHFYDIWIN